MIRWLVILFVGAISTSALAETRWVTGGALSACSDFRQMTIGCPLFMSPDDQVEVVGDVRSPNGEDFYRIQSKGISAVIRKEYLDERSTTISPAENEAREKAAIAGARKRHAAAQQAARVECERRGQPKIGMTPSDLTATCWGRPARVVKRTTAAGVEENYIYGLGHVVKVTDGKVSEIVEAR